MTEIGNVVFSVEKIDQLKAEIERLRKIIRKAQKHIWPLHAKASLLRAIRML